MTNKPMLSVERELLATALKADASIGASAIELVNGWAAMAKLRALLDKPADPKPGFKKIEMAHVVNALDDVRGKPVLTSNQCHDLARALNDRLLSPLQLLELPQKYASAAQHQGEPFAWYTEDYLTDKSATTYDLATKERWKAKGWPVSPLYAERPAPVAVVMPFKFEAVVRTSYSDGWNAALAEVARLNGVKP